MIVISLQEYENVREEYLKAKEVRKEAVKKYRAVHHEYSPIEVKHREQEKAVKRFKEAEQVRKGRREGGREGGRE